MPSDLQSLYNKLPLCVVYTCYQSISGCSGTWSSASYSRKLLLPSQDHAGDFFLQTAARRVDSPHHVGQIPSSGSELCRERGSWWHADISAQVNGRKQSIGVGPGKEAEAKLHVTGELYSGMHKALNLWMEPTFPFHTAQHPPSSTKVPYSTSPSSRKRWLPSL